MAKGKSGGGMNGMMKTMGRNLAKAANQGGGAKAPAKFAKGGGVGFGSALKDSADASGAGKARGGKSSKGNAFKGTF